MNIGGITYTRGASPICSARQGNILGALALAGLLAFKLLLAEDDFSYDYSAYISYLDLLRDYSFADIVSRSGALFPYVVIPQAPVFEFGFVLFAKAMLDVMQSSEATYAAIAALSLGLRVYVMRQLRCSWLWIMLVQIYAVSLFEANAIRVGFAATLVVLGLYKILNNQNRWGFFFLGVSLCIHLQAALFVAPFSVMWLLRKQTERFSFKVMIVLAFIFLAMVAVSSAGQLAIFEKMSDYAGKESGSAGLNLISVSAVVFAFSALFLRPTRPLWDSQARVLWICSVLAVVPSLVLFLTATNIAALGDRAWQFSFAVVSALIHTPWINKKKKALCIGLLGTVAIISAINVTLRYPLSNLFDFILPHVHIQGWL